MAELKIASVTTAVLFTICLMMSNACGAEGKGEAQTPAQEESPVIRGQLWFEPSERMFYGGLGDSCEVKGQFYNLRAGTPVVVRDAAGSSIATGALEPGIIVEPNLMGAPHACRFAFAVQVPTDIYYKIEVADSSGTNTLGLSYRELELRNWRVDWVLTEP